LKSAPPIRISSPPERRNESTGGADMFGNPSTQPGSLFDELWRLQQEVDELFGSWTAPGGIRSLPRGSFPAVNIGHTPERVEVFLFAPGIDPKTLDISIQQNLLTVSGRRDLELDEQATYYRQERFNGEFRRVLSLPEDIDPERVSASYRDGIVQIGLERREAARPRQIEIH
jgi:HSP20 family protein